MTRDYAKSNRPSPKRKNTRVSPSRKPTPGWIWFIAGILVGALAMGIINYSPQQSEADSNPTAATQAPPVEKNSAPSPKPRFDFYTLLKETEVIVPEEENQSSPDTVNLANKVKEITAKEPEEPAKSEPGLAASEKTESAKAGNTNQTDQASYTTVYVLQAGSFKSAADADSVRARLLLLNLQASIEKVTTGNNETWHRVLIGPFHSKAESGEARAILTQNGIDSIQLKRRL